VCTHALGFGGNGRIHIEDFPEVLQQKPEHVSKSERWWPPYPFNEFGPDFIKPRLAAVEIAIETCKNIKDDTA